MVYPPKSIIDHRKTRSTALHHNMTTWMNFESITLHQRSHTKGYNGMLPFIRNVQNRQIHGDREEISGCQRLEEGQWGLAANGYRVSFQDDENVLELVVTAAHFCEYSQCVVKRWDVNYISKNVKLILIFCILKQCNSGVILTLKLR